jgi:hypothetical protein
MACCDLFIIQNTGVTENIVNYYNCNNELITFTAQTGVDFYINGCFEAGITGSTINVRNTGPTSDYFLMSGCCTEDTFVLYGNPYVISLGITLYSEQITSTIGDGPDLNGCYTCVETGKGVPPEYPIYDFILANSENFLYVNCEDCLTLHPCVYSDCQCYIFKTPEEPMLTTYIDCEFNILEVYLPTGKTTSLCSVIRPIFDIEYILPIKLGGLCISGECPNYEIPVTIEPRNECDVLTIFPMEVNCIVQQPSGPGIYDGAATLSVTGGTPPYEIVWDSGSIAPTIYNLNAGEYGATVTDFYGDFVINTTCVLTAETTSTTTTTTTIHPIEYGKLCAIATIRSNSKVTPVEYLQIELDTNGIINGKESWISSDTQYLLSWITGATNQWVLSGYPSPYVNIVNSNPSIPPLTGWQILGSLEVYAFTILSGECSENTLIGFNITKNDPTCGNDGSILLQAYGGSGIYEYSIDNGINYTSNPMFQNLAPGTYIIYVKDSNGVTFIQNTILVQQPTPFYTIGLNLNTATNTFSINCPSLLPGDTLMFDLNNNSNLQYYPNTLSPVPSYNNVVTINGFGPMTLVSTNNSQNILSLPCSVTPITQLQQVKSYSNQITLSYGQTITGSFTNSLVNSSSGDCVLVQKSYQLFITNAKINNCKCCSVIIKNPPLDSLVVTKV